MEEAPPHTSDGDDGEEPPHLIGTEITQEPDPVKRHRNLAQPGAYHVG
jgi:hypothetical protein